LGGLWNIKQTFDAVDFLFIYSVSNFETETWGIIRPVCVLVLIAGNIKMTLFEYNNILGEDGVPW